MSLPNAYKNFRRTDSQLEEFYIFCISLDNKNHNIHNTTVKKFLTPAYQKQLTPFEYIEFLYLKGMLQSLVRDARLGKYKRISEILIKSLNINLKRCSVEQLERIPSITPYTARLFITNTQHSDHILLNLEILNDLYEHGLIDYKPKAVPDLPSRYAELEKIVIDNLEPVT